MPNRFGQSSCSGGRQSRLLDRGQLTSPTNGADSKDHVVFLNINRSTKYYVEWKGSATKTWEPLKNLQGCIELVEKFDNRINKQ